MDFGARYGRACQDMLRRSGARIIWYGMAWRDQAGLDAIRSGTEWLSTAWISGRGFIMAGCSGARLSEVG